MTKLYFSLRSSAFLVLFLVFMIDSNSIQAQLLTQNFAGTSLPTGWTSSNTCSSTSTNAYWKFSTSGMGYGASSVTDHTPGGGTRFAWVDGSSPYPCLVSMTTSTISATVGDALELSFWVFSNNIDVPGNNTLSVDYYDGATWHNGVYSFAGNNSSWFQAIVGLGAYPVTGSGNIQLRFNVDKLSSSASFYNDIAIDDVSLIVLLPCSNPPVAGTILASTTQACATETVNLALTGVVNAQGLTRQWQDSTATGTWNDIFGATSTQHSQTISQPTYFRCKSVCSGGTAVYSDTILVDQAPFFNCYCSAGATSTTYGYIEDFEFADIQFTSPTGCGQSYTNNTNLVGTVFFGNTYNLAAYVNNCTGTTTYNTGFKVWIDYNQNGSFSDPGEEVISQNLTYYQTHGGPITIPATALTGVTGMRVMVVESGSLAAMNPCYSFTWGEVEDYSINIQTPPINDAGVSEIVTPMIPYCGGDSVVRVKLMNYGSDTLFSATINLEINGGTPITSSWTGMIPPFTIDTAIVVAGTNPAGGFNQGDDIMVYTSLPNGVSDSLAINDTVTLAGLTSGLAGVYDIPGDFATISGAVDTLNMFGTCDTVWFALANGTYDESVIITEFPRYMADAPVIFKSANNDSSLVTWDNTSATRTIDLAGADFIWFSDLTIKNSAGSAQNVIAIGGGANNNRVERSHLIGASLSTTSNLYSVIYNMTGLDEYNAYVDNFIEKGSMGIYSYGNSTTSLERGTWIEGNTIEDFYYMGCYNYYQEDITVKDNSLTSTSTYTSMYGIYFYYANGEFELSGNHVYPTAGTDGFYMGAYISQGIGNDPFNRGLIANNVFIAGRAGETGTVYAMYTANASAKNFYHNTFIVLDGGTSARALYASGNNLAEYMNNIFAVLPYDSNSTYGTGNAAYFTGGIVFGIDGNDYYAEGSTPIYFNANYASLESYQQATSNDLNSFDVNPNFTDTLNAILCNDSLDAAAFLTPVMYDFGGNMRDPNTPDIGAREFQGIANFNIGPDTTICDIEATLLVGAGGSSVQWIDGNSSTISTGNSVVVNSQTVFPVGVSYTNSCGTASDDITLSFVPNVSLDPAVHICAGDVLTLTPDGNGSPNATYSWFPTGEMTSQIDVTSAGVYGITKSEDGCVSQASITVTQSQAVTLVDAEVCQADLPYSVDATIIGGINYVWTGGSTPTAAQNEFNASGDYSVIAADSMGCSTTDTFHLEVIDTPVAVISNDSHSSNLFYLSSILSQNVGSNASYFWNFGDGSTSTDANPTHLFPWNGQPQTFTVTLTIINDCGTSETVSMDITSDPLGVNSIAVNALNIYPNPSTGVISVVANFRSNSMNVDVLDVTGRVVYSKTILSSGNRVDLDLTTLSKGTYFIKVNNGADTFNGQVILQ